MTPLPTPSKSENDRNNVTSLLYIGSKLRCYGELSFQKDRGGGAVAPSAVSREETILGRSRRGTLFHIASEITYPDQRPHEWRIHWLCGPTIEAQHLAPDFVVLPTVELFGGMDERSACVRCWRRHDAPVIAALDAADEERYRKRRVAAR